MTKVMTLFPIAGEQIKNHPIGKEYLKKAIYSKEQLAILVEKIKSQGKSIVWTNGAFDVLHPGHITLLQHAATCGDVLIVGINSDKSIQKYKPIKSGIPRPIINEDLRIVSLLSLKHIDHVLVFDEPSPIDYIHIIKPNVWVRGASYQKDYNMKMEEHPEGQAVTLYGGKCIELPMVGEFSTTDLVTKIGSLLKKD